MSAALRSLDSDALAPMIAPAIELARTRLDGELRALVLFGSCLSPATARPGSIPDLFAIVGNLDASLVALGAGTITRALAAVLPPITLSLRRDERSAPLGKLNLITAASASVELAAARDLYLAGRLSKRTELVWSRDRDASADVAGLVDAAIDRMATLALLGLPRRAPLDEVVRRCVALSYRAEPRPEHADKIAALFDAHADLYRHRFGPRLIALARHRGLQLIGDTNQPMLLDDRDDTLRAREAIELTRTLGRSRRRMVARWPKQMLVYRGWLPYVLAKLRRARAR